MLAIAIKQLIAISVFTPSPSELREAMKSAAGTIGSLEGYASGWLTLLEQADAIVFEYDRAAWDAAYANFDSKVPLALEGRLFETADDEEFPPSPRWRALNELWERKHEAEEAETSARIAACKTKPVAKRTPRKPKREG